MKLTFEKELAIKRGVIKATEKGIGVSKLAEHFGVSKSTIYKYRRILTEQGFLIKESDGVYLVAQNKYSNKSSSQPKIHTLDLSITDSDNIYSTEETIAIKSHSLERESTNNPKEVNTALPQTKESFKENPKKNTKRKNFVKKIFNKVKKKK